MSRPSRRQKAHDQRYEEALRLLANEPLARAHLEFKKEGAQLLHMMSDGGVATIDETHCYGVDEEGDVLLRVPHCKHVLGFPLETLKSLVARHGDGAMLVATCPDCPGETIVAIKPFVDGLA